MSTRVLVATTAPVTQTVEAVVELLRYIGRPSQPLPETVQLPGILLLLRNKKDAFYATTAQSCSCPSSMYRPGQACKHRRKYFPAQKPQQAARAATQSDSDSIRPEAKWAGGFNGPVEVD